MRKAATLGPTMRARLNIMEFMEIADVKSFLSTISAYKAWRAGMSKVLVRPSRVARTSTCQYLTTPNKVSVAKTAARIPKQLWVTSKNVAFRKTFHEGASNQGKKQYWESLQHCDYTKHVSRIVRQFQHQPTLTNILNPRTYKGNCLAKPKKSKVPVAKCRKRPIKTV